MYFRCTVVSFILEMVRSSHADLYLRTDHDLAYTTCKVNLITDCYETILTTG
jgi:hypothetical protein